MKIAFKDIFKSVIYITPDFNNQETVRYKFKSTQILLWLLGFILVIILITTTVIGLTPIKHWLFHFENNELQHQAEKTLELEQKVQFLTRELQSLASTNKKLEYAYLLATSDSIDTNSAIYDSLKYESRPNLPYGGNVFAVFQKILTKLLQVDENKIITFIKPSKSFLIKEFDAESGHYGVDFASKSGSPVFASLGGLIIFADYTVNDGNKIIIQHDNGFITIYKHCSSIIKKERDFVMQGELIALSGNSGLNTSGPHLHFEIWKNGKPLNPKEFFIK